MKVVKRKVKHTHSDGWNWTRVSSHHFGSGVCKQTNKSSSARGEETYYKYILKQGEASARRDTK